MNRKIKKLLVLIIAMFIAVITFQSCGALLSLTTDPSFQEGFRQGWNTTAPEEYHY